MLPAPNPSIAVKPFVGPIQLPPLPPPPLQVIGSWRDEEGSKLFIAAPQGVLQVRTGDVLLGNYRVKEITQQQVLLQEIPTQRDVALAVPAGVSALR